MYCVLQKKRDVLTSEDEDGNSVFNNVVEEREEFIPDEALDKAELRKAIQEMVDNLPEEQRTAIMMRYFDEMSVKEIAEVQSVTEGTVKSRLNYGRKAIKNAVEDYEKKNNVKLRSTGVVPLLLWIFKDCQVASGGATIGNVASTVLQTGTISKAGMNAGKKIASAFTKKLIAGITAATVVTGGIIAGVMLRPDERPLQWVGYSDSMFYVGTTDRFEVDIQELEDEYIKGQLKVIDLYEVEHDTQFEGKGIVEGNQVRYQVVFETPYIYTVIGDVKYEYGEIEMIYDKESESFTLDDFYEVVLERETLEEEKTLVQNKSWSGYGEDELCIGTAEHLFELDVYEMTETGISGKLTVKKKGTIEHESEFTGRGFKEDKYINLEIKLDTPREEEFIAFTSKVDNFWLQYNCETNEFEIPFPCHYEVLMKEK